MTSSGRSQRAVRATAGGGAGSNGGSAAASDAIAARSSARQETYDRLVRRSGVVKDSDLKCGFAVEFSGQRFPLRTRTMGTDTLLDVSGRVDGCPLPDGTLELTGTVTLDRRSEVAGDRHEVMWLVDAIGGQPMESFEMELSSAETREQHLMYYARGERWTKIRFIDAATPTPAATLTYYNAFDEHVGNFRLTVVPVAPECDP